MQAEQESRASNARPLAAEDPAAIGAYRLLGRLGEGGMGAVYLGVGPDGRRVAVKVVRPELAAVPSFRARFGSEVANAQRVASFCTARVIEHGEAGGAPYLVTEYIDGPSLQEHISAHGPLAGAALRGLAVGTAHALSAIHAVRLVHRDLKPRNVMLAADGPRVIDFGIARALDSDERHTRTGDVVGTPGWIAPEQFFDGRIGTEADVFVWGTLVAYAATGRHPHGTGTLATLAERARQARYDLTGVPIELQALVRAALEPDPRRRPSAEQLLTGLVGTYETQRAATTVVHDGWASLGAAPTVVQGAAPTVTDTPRPQRPTWQLSAVSAVVTAVVVGSASVGILMLGDDAPPKAKAPAKSAGPPVTKVVDLCALASAPVITKYAAKATVQPGSSVPAEQAGTDGAATTCEWTTISMQDANGMRNDRVLQAKITLRRDGAGRTAAGQAAQDFAQAQQKERGYAEEVKPNVTYGPVSPVPGLGDQAFGISKVNRRDAVGMGGAVVQQGNVVLDVRYAGADYPPQDSSKAVALDPQKARTAAAEIAQDLLRNLAACSACHA
ncbi:serine/threonine-protein kinase [Actinomadura macrotermitis]|uniref:Serine/threonine-protein kinase PknD n=1 Tax=Actinomadura macrotermitis TaxID=2585200 RepID=A0A7K0BSL9_9ACTN|nr:serine/threonine-protein kinase [Actinomadura macrotermitis]MQY04180.1 Serine/threonine-protein kinase PknD [Actinomadura macrotermitis]